MGAMWISWRPTTAIILMIQIQGVICAETTAVTGVEGQTFFFRCEYSNSLRDNAKYFKRDDDMHSNLLILTKQHNDWVPGGRFSLFDNTSEAVFIVEVHQLMLEDSGKYCCGVDIDNQPDHVSYIQLSVSKGGLSSTPPMPITVSRLHLPLYLTVVMCMAAILCVCLFTLGLLLVVNHRRSSSHQHRETSSDYETMMPGVGTEPEHQCGGLLQNFQSPPPDLCSHFKSKQRESTVTLGLSEYVDVDAPGHICQYGQLDLSRLEEHVYHSLNGNRGSKVEPQGVKEQIHC